MKAKITETFFPFTLELKIETQKEAEILYELGNHMDKIPHIISENVSGTTSGDVTFLLNTISRIVMSKLDAEKMLMRHLEQEINNGTKNIFIE